MHFQVVFNDDNEEFHLSHLVQPQGSYDSKLHFHEGFEIYVAVSGRRHYFIEDSVYLVLPGDVILIRPNVLHKTSDAGSPGYERIVINFSPSFIPEDDRRNGVVFGAFGDVHNKLDVRGGMAETVNRMLQTMADEIRGKQQGYYPYLRSLLVQLLVRLTRHAAAHATGCPIETHTIDSRTKDIISYIYTHYTERITLQSLADHFYISPYYLSRTFKKETGFTVIEYVTTIRIREAQRLLRETQHKIGEVSELVGFGTIPHFNSVFRRKTNLSPKEYRRVVRAVHQ